MNAELEEKTGRITAMLARLGLDAVLLNAQHNFAWLTGGGSNGIDLSRENGVASLLVTADGRRAVIANNIEMPRLMIEEVSGDDFEPMAFGWQDEKADSGIIRSAVLKFIGGQSRFATDIPMFAGVDAIEGEVAACRFRLTADEADRYRTLGRETADAMWRTCNAIEPGNSELEIAERLRHELGSAGIASVVTLVGADLRIAAFRHPVPTEHRLEKTVMMATCGKRGGLIASMSRIVSFGQVSAELAAITHATAGVNAALQHATRPGVTGAELYKTAADAYAAAGCESEIDRHHQGGAIGYRTREWVAHPMCAETVQEDQAFAWNPTITGTKIEDTIIVNAGGSETITASPHFPTIASTIDGVVYYSPDIISL